jgi:hypothetical protein
MTDDIVTRLLDFTPWSDADLARTLLEAADEIERLRTALALAVGELSTHAQYSVYSPEQLMQQFLGEARRD